MGNYCFNKKKKGVNYQYNMTNLEFRLWMIRESEKGNVPDKFLNTLIEDAKWQCFVEKDANTLNSIKNRYPERFKKN